MSSPGDANTPSDSQTTGLIINLVVGVPTLLVCLFVFDILRKRVPSVFEARRLLNIRRDPLDYYGNRVYSPPPPSYRLFGWVGPVINLDLETIAETHGLDAALYLRYLRAMTAFFFCLSLPCAALLPVYVTANNEQKSPPPAGVERFSLANVPRDDPWRFWVTLAIDYVVTAITCAYLSYQFALYSKDRRRYRSTKNPANYAILVHDIPHASCSEHAVYHYWDRLFPDQVARAYFIYDGAKLVTKKQKFWDAVTRRERAEWDMEFNDKLDSERPMHKTGRFAACRGKAAEVDSIDYWAEQQQHYGAKIALYQQEHDQPQTPATRTAVVVFKTRRAAAVASQTLFATKESQWRVMRAPEPKAVNWAAFGIASQQVPIRSAITFILCILLTLFWVIPVTAIMGLANLSALADIKIDGSQPFKFLDSVADWSPVLTGLIESFLPAVILSIFLGLVPTFLRMFVKISSVSSLPDVDNLVRDYYFNFVIFSNFLFVSFGATLLSESVIPAIIDKPSSVVDLLAEAFPKQAGFLMNFILLKALTETPMDLLQIGRVVVRWIMLKFVAATPRQRNKVETGNTMFVYLRYYGIAQLVALLGIVYSTIQPFILPVCFAYFCVMYLVWKYNLCFSMYNPYEAGGVMYGGSLYGLWIGLIIHLLTMIGLFGLNKNPAQSALIVIPALFAVFFLLHIRKRYDRVLEHGSALETQRRVEEEEGEDMIGENLARTYLHPGFEPLPDPIENLNGVGGNNGHVTFEDVDIEDRVEASSKAGPTDADTRQGYLSSSEEWRDAHGSQDLTQRKEPP